MKAIITVVGRDRVGIIAQVCSHLATQQVNILDISQTIVQEFFNMLMIVQLPPAAAFEEIASDLAQLGESMNMDIKLQREDIFQAMHRV